MFKKPLEGPRRAIYWHVLQTYAAAEIAFNRYVALFPKSTWPYLWAKRPNESEKTVFLTGQRQIHFKSGHKFQDLRAETLHGAIIDECRQQRKQLWFEIMRPMLGRYKGWCDFYSTPNGYDWVYDLYQTAQGDPEWARFHSSSAEAWWWTPEEIESARRSTSEPVFAQEYLAEFRSLTSGRVYYSFGEHSKRLDCPWYSFRDWSPYHSVIVGMDFNVNPMHWTLGQTANHFWWWFDEIHLPDSNTPEAADVLVQKISLMKAAGYQPPDADVILCGDQTAERRDTRGPGSDYSIIHQKLKAAGIRYRDATPKINPAVRDRVNAVNARCKSTTGEVAMWFHPGQCKYTIHDMERVVWKDSAKDFVLDPGKDGDLTHASDSIGYPVAEMSPIRDIVHTKLKIITRSF